jgi:hypothetical protein
MTLFPNISEEERKAYLVGTFSEKDFCPVRCEHLSITEDEQNKRQDKPDHICLKYNQRVKHGAYHPRLFRCNECVLDGMNRLEKKR